jgi:U2-associated protein SR140
MWRKVLLFVVMMLNAQARGEDLRNNPLVRRAKPGLTGFVCYMTRRDAERAVSDFDGYEWNGSVLRVSWSKPVPIPARHSTVSNGCHPKADHNTDESYRSSRSVGRSTLAPEQTGLKRRRSASPDSTENKSFWVNQVDRETLDFVKAVAERIKAHGADFKDMLLEREKNNPRFMFLFDQAVCVLDIGNHYRATLPGSSHHVFQSFLDPSYTFPKPPAVQFDDEVRFFPFCISLTFRDTPRSTPRIQRKNRARPRP